MPVIGEPGTVTVAKPDIWEVDGFSFHNQMQPVTVGEDGEVTVNSDGIRSDGIRSDGIRAYAVVEVVAGVMQKDGSMSEVARQAVRIEGEAFMAATARYPGLYILVAQALYEELQYLGHVPKGDVPMTDEERKAIVEYAKALLERYNG